MYFVRLASGQIYKAIGHSEVLLKLEIIKKAVSISILFLFVVFSSNVVVFAFATILTILLVLIIDSITLRKYIDYKFRLQILDFLPNIVISLVMYFLVSIIGMTKLNMYIELILQVAVGLISYMILSVVSKNKNFKFVINIIKSFLSGKTKNNSKFEEK